MKLYRYTIGVHDKFGAAEDEQDAFEKREEIDPNFAFLPVEITEVTIGGHDITVKPITEPEPEPEQKKKRKVAE